MSTTSKEIMKQCANSVQSIKKNKLVVLLENCLQDVPRKDKNCGCDTQQGLSSNITSNEVLEIQFISDSQNKNVSVSDPVLPNSKEDSSDCSNQTGHEPAPQTLNMTKSLFLDLPITSTIENDDTATSGIIDNDSTLYWRRVTQPVECEVKIPLTSGNSSGVELDLTPPCSIASSRSPIEDSASTSLEEELNNNVDNKILTDQDKQKELIVELVSIEPTVQQLQILYTRNDRDKIKSLSLRPKRDRKQFIPFMFEQANYIKKRKPRLFHSTPKVNDTSSEKIRKITPNTNCRVQLDRKFEKKQIKMDRKRKKAIAMKQLKIALRQKEAYEKQQLKLALKKKKEALKWRNKLENALTSINRRICNQNTFWKMLPS
ncbi:uncharacterized protein LOC114517981 [Dendronephthya gigantea]|uniref:uncharacterized protein LOC114517981 n=1 Tax=Dendronephthya gigantea TaxID=151771 RepID=UPI00106D2E4F|nr:uncharacterized protein LOC114517981 [Dendronephthya gigantea]XP_028393640.1 uncharacterized protein LOC114517981 [Dendronephthya gigantea]